jgi:hypothetical protein
MKIILVHEQDGKSDEELCPAAKLVVTHPGEGATTISLARLASVLSSESGRLLMNQLFAREDIADMTIEGWVPKWVRIGRSKPPRNRD